MGIRFVLVLLALGIVAAPVAAQEVTVTSKFRPIYMGAQGGEFHPDPVLQTDVFVALPRGFFVDIWSSTGFDTEKNFGKELDLVVGRAGTFRKIAYSTDFEYFFVQGIDVVNVNGEISFQFLFVKLEAYSPTQKGGPGKGMISSAGMRLLGKPLFERISRIKLDVGQWVKHDSGSFGFDRAWLYQGNLAGNVSINSHTNVSAGFRWSIPLNKPNDQREGKMVWEFGISQRF